MALQNGERQPAFHRGIERKREREIDCTGKIDVFFFFSSLGNALSMPNVETRMSRCSSSQALHIVPTTSIYILNYPYCMAHYFNPSILHKDL